MTLKKTVLKLAVLAALLCFAFVANGYVFHLLDYSRNTMLWITTGAPAVFVVVCAVNAVFHRREAHGHVALALSLVVVTCVLPVGSLMSLYAFELGWPPLNYVDVILFSVMSALSIVGIFQSVLPAHGLKKQRQ